MVSPSRPKLTSIDSTADALAVAVDHLDERFIQCRDIRHTWKVARNFHQVTAGQDGASARMGHYRYVERKLVCTRCSTERTEAYAVIESARWSALRRLSVSYSYPDGYQLHGIPADVRNAAELVRGLQWSRMEAGPRVPRKKASGG
jgi:hypothetical protein